MVDFMIAFAFTSIVIPSLLGTSKHLNPDETIEMTAEEVSWLSEFRHFALNCDSSLLKLSFRLNSRLPIYWPADWMCVVSLYFRKVWKKNGITFVKFSPLCCLGDAFLCKFKGCFVHCICFIRFWMRVANCPNDDVYYGNKVEH